MAKQNPWFVHMAQVRKDNPKIKDVAKLSKIGKSTYKPNKK